ncbi:hypothetical protein DPMN_162601 [Dreissena polymorpha]|uniref:Uncharacterized protein n=1 Tax=Dreissena polymorpha TaxID=45954 RepID=A0A9D4IUH0_DREPO|nr:hypothetical protein DPMN_162601 [Dreissena polymorpha]
MKVSLGRPVKVNNFLTTLNITLIANRNLKKMEARAWEAIKKISTASSNKAVIDAYEKEWSKCKNYLLYNVIDYYGAKC